MTGFFRFEGSMSEEINNLEDLLDRIAESAADQDQITLKDIVEAVGRRSFGPLLLMAGFIMASPVSGIPGMPTSMSVLVLLIAVQLIIRRDFFWMPQWLLKRSIGRSKLDKALKWLTPPARFVDRFLQPRLTFLVRDAGNFVVAMICVIIAAGMPAMELVPFSATIAGFALAIFGLALVADDGLLVLIAFALTVATLGFAANYLFG
jgi:hypothetical protein